MIRTTYFGKIRPLLQEKVNNSYMYHLNADEQEP